MDDTEAAEHSWHTHALQYEWSNINSWNGENLRLIADKNTQVVIGDALVILWTEISL